MNNKKVLFIKVFFFQNAYRLHYPSLLFLCYLKFMSQLTATQELTPRCRSVKVDSNRLGEANYGWVSTSGLWRPVFSIFPRFRSICVITSRTNASTFHIYLDANWRDTYFCNFSPDSFEGRRSTLCSTQL